jgi:hypothetical protein
MTFLKGLLPVKMMLKLSFTFLVAVSSTLTILPQAQALRPTYDLFIHVLNSTSHPLEICNSELTFCKEILPGKTFDDAHATENKTAEYFGFWLSHTVVKVCERTIPLKKMINDPVEDKGWWGKVTYRLTVPEEGYLRECSTAALQK